MLFRVNDVLSLQPIDFARTPLHRKCRSLGKLVREAAKKIFSYWPGHKAGDGGGGIKGPTKKIAFLPI